MSTAKDIKSRINNIGKTSQITRAMEMISVSKLRKARLRMTASRPYAKIAQAILGHVANSHPEYKHPYLVSQDKITGAGYIVISTDRSLCGGLNLQIFKACLAHIQQWKTNDTPVKMGLIGHRGELFFRRMPVEIIAYAGHLGNQPELKDIIGEVRVMLDAYLEGTINRLYLVYNHFGSTMHQNPVVQQLLPIVPPENADTSAPEQHWDYIYEAEAKELLTVLGTRYIESQVYQGLVENIACEHAARMIAMKNATESAEDLVSDLQLEYNKARQANITKELAEIVSGGSIDEEDDEASA